jgi:hypothetical protein
MGREREFIADAISEKYVKNNWYKLFN